MRPRRIVVVFARAPRIGLAKRRLARDMGAVEAWRFYRACLAHLARSLGRDRRWRLILAVTPDPRRRPRWARGLTVVGQGTGDLGRRMARALDRLPPGPAVLVGSDIPDIRPAHIAAAFDGLRRADAVLGPARDGGYWLIGRRHGLRPLPRLLGVRWSTADALEDTRAALGPAVTTALIARLDDIDDGADLRAWRARPFRGTVRP
jgi:rSAM/selenodomain-associated transferase 1